MSELFQPGKIGQVEIRNRIVMPSMGMRTADEGHVTQRTIDYYTARAKGGVGLIVIGVTSAVPGFGITESRPRLDDDRFIASFRKLTSAVHQHGARIGVQFIHHEFGAAKTLESDQSSFQTDQRLQVLTPSVEGSKVLGQTNVKEITPDDIAFAVEAFATATRRAKEAGFDVVEFHACHGCTLGAFLSPFINRRTDQYGGSPENRARFICEIITRTRHVMRTGFPIMVRINGSDGFKGGLEINEAKIIAKALVASGADAIDVTAGFHGLSPITFPVYMHPNAPLAPLAAEIKKAVNVPVIAVGKIDISSAEQIIRDGKADFIAMARALLADPELPNKAREGRFDEIRSCIYCNNCHYMRTNDPSGRRRTCTVNAALAREGEARGKTSSPKKVMVIGGGLAGLEAARVLQSRGHNVTLYEKSDRLGGQWNIAAAEEHKQGYAAFTDYLVRELTQAKVPIVLNTEVTRELVQQTQPDVVVLATGAKPATLDIPGVSSKNVVQANDLILNKVACGTNVVVVGGRLVGMETAISLAEKGKKVSLVTLHGLGENGTPVEHELYSFLRNKLILNRVPIYQNSPVVEIREDGVHILFNGKELVFLEADTVVLATGNMPEDRLYQELEGIVPSVYKVGDCVSPRNAMMAVNEGYEVGQRI